MVGHSNREYMINKEVSDALDMLFSQAQRQFGSAVRSRWIHTEDDCPGCGNGMSKTRFKGKSLLSLNAFIFREHGVLIAYLLCGKCAGQIFKGGKSEPTGARLPLHDDIEKTLKATYLRKSGH